jgi:hypothetical protein
LLPHAAGEVPGWQAPLGSQQPLAHEALSQVQAPPWHS